jgi:hypothetical protein
VISRTATGTPSTSSSSERSSVCLRQLVDQYIELNSLERFERIPHGRYINFLADYLTAERSASRKAALAAWKKLKKMDMPKTCESWRAVARKKEKK